MTANVIPNQDLWEIITILSFGVMMLTFPILGIYNVDADRKIPPLKMILYSILSGIGFIALVGLFRYLAFLITRPL